MIAFRTALLTVMALTYDFRRAAIRPTMNMTIQHVKCFSLYDTGSNLSLCTKKMFRQIPLNQRPQKIDFCHTATNVSGEKLDILACYLMNCNFENVTLQHPIFVVLAN